MKFLKIIVGILIIALLAGAGLYIYSGGFKRVTIKEETMGPMKFVFAEHHGDYTQTREVQDSIYRALKEEGVNAEKGFGIYYDDPETTPTDSLYSLAGCVLEIRDTNKIKTLERKGFRVETMNETPSIVARFPYKNRLSILLGVFKVYPEMEEYRKKHNLKEKPALEIYTQDSIIFAMERAPE